MSLMDRIANWWSKDAQHLVYVFFPDQQSAPAAPLDSYVRLWCSDMFLAQSRKHFVDRFPSIQASVEFNAANRPPLIQAVIARAGDANLGPGVVRNLKLTDLVPFFGGTVRLQTALIDIEGENHLRLALGLLQDFSALVGPPFATVGTVVAKVSAGIDKIDEAAEAAGKRPILVLDQTLQAAGGGGANVLAGGYHVIIRAEQGEFAPGRLAINGGVLVDNSTGGQVLDGYDYEVIRVEIRVDRDDWRFPAWDAAIARAQQAKLLNQLDDFTAARNSLLADVIGSTDLTPKDRPRVAKRIQEELDTFEFGLAGGAEASTLDAIVAKRGLPSFDDVADLSLAALIK